MALGSDGGGSIRYPAGLTGLFGLKPQRHLVPMGPEHGSGWHDLVVLGPLTRSVRDATLFLDVAANTLTSTRFREATEDTTPALRIAVSTNPPPGTQVTLSDARRRSVADAAALLASLGHHVVDADTAYGYRSLWSSTVRLLKGARDDVASRPDRGRLEARTRTVARLGRVLPDRSLRRALEREPHVDASINRVFETADVVLTPLCEAVAPLISECPTRGALRFAAGGEHVGMARAVERHRPAGARRPHGMDDEHLPTAVQLVGRPGDETTLLRLAAQMERARPVARWAPGG